MVVLSDVVRESSHSSISVSVSYMFTSLVSSVLGIESIFSLTNSCVYTPGDRVLKGNYERSEGCEC